MLTCGLKLTHDGSIALLDGDRLVFNVEVEKLANNLRYSPVENMELVTEVLGDFGFKTADVDAWAVDGWDGRTSGLAHVHNHGNPFDITVAAYRERSESADLTSPVHAGLLPVDSESVSFRSYVHLAGHLASAYCTSPFAGRSEPALALVWDGGTFPRLYHVGPDGRVQNGGPLFPLIGHVYATAAHHFGPFTREDEAETVDDLSVAGKLMAYIALGQTRPEIEAEIAMAYHEHFEADNERVREFRRTIGGWGSNAEPSLRYLHVFFRDLRARTARLGVADEDVLATVHSFLENLLVERLEAKILEWRGPGPWNLCFVGGCALNIKWNTALRGLGVVRSVWVPPFPNDSGSAIGAAVLLRATSRGGGLEPLDWTVRGGPMLRAPGRAPAGWSVSRCDETQLARHLHASQAPVVLLQGRAELGPRALGGRSIVGSATDPAMKETLNRVKDREFYRPVAPICLEEAAPEVFDPGTPDPYMLFEHRIRPEWVDRVPAVMHLDGTARLQTVGQHDDPLVARLLAAYRDVSGVPVLCNTSANYNGRGFFPDVESAAAWGRVRDIWSEGFLYSREYPSQEPGAAC